VVWVPFGAAYWPAKLISCSQGSHNQATVELFGTGLKTEVDASRLAAFADGCADKCQQLHSELGRQVSWLMQMPRVCVRACVCICVCVCVCVSCHCNSPHGLLWKYCHAGHTLLNTRLLLNDIPTFLSLPELAVVMHVMQHTMHSAWNNPPCWVLRCMEPDAL
jgi:hypothetical protein